MLAELKFVQGAVAKKDYVPSLTHFCIENGTVRGYNGALALCSPIPLDIACKPKAGPLVQAIRNCNETVSMTLTAAGRLSIRSGKFRALVDCVEGETPHVAPEGEDVAINGEALLQGLRAVEPFIADDASRPWSNGVLIKGQSLFATNNVTLVEYWTGVDFPLEINLPRAAVKEIVRIGEPPTRAQASASSFSLHYDNARWIRSNLLATNWPDLSKVLNRESTQKPMPEHLFDALEVVKPFVDKTGRVTFHQGTVCTSLVEGEGASYEVPDLAGVEGAYHIDMLALLNGVAHTADFSTYPGPVVFHGDRLRGVIIGLRQIKEAA